MSFGSVFSTIRDALNELLEPNDFKISTWMAMGALLLLVAQSYLPSNIGSRLPIIYLVYRLVKMFLDTWRLHTGSYTSLQRGRWTASLPEHLSPAKTGSNSDGLVMFVLGARINQFVSFSEPQQHYCDTVPNV